MKNSFSGSKALARPGSPQPPTLHQVKVCGLFGQLLADESTADKDSVKIDQEGEIVGFKEKKVVAPLLLAAPACARGGHGGRQG